MTFDKPRKHRAVVYSPGLRRAPEWAPDVDEHGRNLPESRIAMLEAQVHYLSEIVDALIWRGVQ